MDFVEQIQALNRIGIALTSETNLHKLMKLILDEACKLTGADSGSLYLKEKNNLTFYVTKNKTLNDMNCFCDGGKRHRLPISKESFAGFVSLTGEILFIEDAYNLPPFLPYKFNYDFDRENNYRTRSVLVVPLMTPDNNVVGVLQLINAMDAQGNVVSFADDVVPLSVSLASQAAVSLRNARLIHDTKQLLRSIIQFSASAIDARSPHTAGHSQKVADYSKAVAEAINRQKKGPFAKILFTPDQMEELHYAAWLHDIGKIGIPESILDKQNKVSDAVISSIRSRFELFKTIKTTNLFRADDMAGFDDNEIQTQCLEIEKGFQDRFDFVNRVNSTIFLSEEDMETLKSLAAEEFETMDGKTIPCLEPAEFAALSVRKGNLTNEEYKHIQSHVVHTKHIIDSIPFPEYLENVPLFASSHHEMLDGSGYPKGLKGDALPLQARILGMVDIFDALTASDRPYRKSMPVEKALDFLQREGEKGRLDKDLVNLFIENKLYDVVGSGEQTDYFL